MTRRKKKKPEDRPVVPEPIMEEATVEWETDDEPTPEEEVVVAPPKTTWQQLVQELPEANSVPTQRWYGEVFYPKYSAIREQLQALANE